MRGRRAWLEQVQGLVEEGRRRSYKLNLEAFAFQGKMSMSVMASMANTANMVNMVNTGITTSMAITRMTTTMSTFVRSTVKKGEPLEKRAVDSAFDADAVSNDGQWSGPEFEHDDWFYPEDHGRRHHRGPHPRLMNAMLHRYSSSLEFSAPISGIASAQAAATAAAARRRSRQRYQLSPQLSFWGTKNLSLQCLLHATKRFHHPL